ncbi:MAG TPA: alanine racemase [Candidatus Limnocylindrales bacterium]|nr:alanine racemase [Candidatus Limnocylindrales bacterium]
MTTHLAAPADDLAFAALPDGLDTPRLVLDLARVEANIARLQAELDRRGIALRPHAKTHKSVAVARMQLAAGARGITVGTLGEAEVFVGAGIPDVFLAYPLWAAGPKATRLRALHEATPALRVGVDSVAGAERLAAAVARSARPLVVRVEIDSGNGRTGVASPESAVEIARAARAGGLDVEGVFSHGGHGYRVGGAEPAGADEVRTLGAAVSALRSEGFEAPVVSAGSTPTMLSAATGGVTEMRAGTYAYGDRQQWALGSIPVEGCALAVAATVVSVHADRIVLDAGAKALTKDRATWLTGFGAIVGYPDLVIERVNDYHGIVAAPAGVARPSLGDVVAVIPNHVCPVVDLVDSVTVLRPDGATETWPVDARGRSG